MTGTAHVALYDSLADWEVGYLLVELRTGRFTGEPWEIVTVASSTEPVTSMGGVRMTPDLVLADLDPAASDLLVLPGADLWDDGRGRRVHRRSRPVPERRGAGGRHLRGDRRTRPVPGCWTSGATPVRRRSIWPPPDTGVATHYVDERAVVDGDLITAGPQSPVQFARATLSRLGLASEETLEAYETVFHRGDPSGYPALMQAGPAE